MIFQTNLTIPANTDIDNIVSSNIILVNGVITGFELDFPPGCCGLVYGRVMYREQQMWPNSPEEWFRQDNHVFRYDEIIELREGPYIFRLEGYNLDIKYEHTLTLRIIMDTVARDINSYIQSFPLR